jgi:hypothetical protein
MLAPFPGWGEFKTALGAALRLSVFDRSGASALAGDMAACARSFWTCVLALPSLYLPLAFELAAMPTGGHPVPVLIARSLGYVVGCVAFPLAAFPMLRWFEKAERWPKLVYGYT